MQVKDLTTDELKALIRETVLEVLEDFLPDPDAGLTVKPEFEQSLLAIQQRRAAGASAIRQNQAASAGISAAEVAERLGLDRS
jgi:hypothetical protein